MFGQRGHPSPRRDPPKRRCAIFPAPNGGGSGDVIESGEPFRPPAAIVYDKTKVVSTSLDFRLGH